jgi:hypothetical protein
MDWDQAFTDLNNEMDKASTVYHGQQDTLKADQVLGQILAEAAQAGRGTPQTQDGQEIAPYGALSGADAIRAKSDAFLKGMTNAGQLSGGTIPLATIQSLGQHYFDKLMSPDEEAMKAASMMERQKALQENMGQRQMSLQDNRPLNLSQLQAKLASGENLTAEEVAMLSKTGTTTGMKSTGKFMPGTNEPLMEMPGQGLGVMRGGQFVPIETLIGGQQSSNFKPAAPQRPERPGAGNRSYTTPPDQEGIQYRITEDRFGNELNRKALSEGPSPNTKKVMDMNDLKGQTMELLKKARAQQGGGSADTRPIGALGNPPAGFSDAPSNMPNPMQYAGRTGTDQATGKRYRSNGKTWVEVR